MWRVTDDFWDKWELLLDMFRPAPERWYPLVGAGALARLRYASPGHIGIRSTESGASDRRSRFTYEEQRTMMSLWSIFRSPLMMGGEMRDNDERTLSLLSNPEVIAVDQGGSRPRPMAIEGRPIGIRARPAIVWSSEGPEGSTYLALFNVGESPLEVRATWAELGLEGEEHGPGPLGAQGPGTRRWKRGGEASAARIGLVQVVEIGSVVLLKHGYIDLNIFMRYLLTRQLNN